MHLAYLATRSLWVPMLMHFHGCQRPDFDGPGIPDHAQGSDVQIATDGDHADQEALEFTGGCRQRLNGPLHILFVRLRSSFHGALRDTLAQLATGTALLESGPDHFRMKAGNGTFAAVRVAQASRSSEA